jgi:riboflavin kinase/FMN adenylyltransferase
LEYLPVTSGEEAVLVEDELARFSPDKDTAITIGVFDGVHRGHKYLLDRLKEKARAQNLLTGVVTFRQHPEDVLFPKSKLPFLTDMKTRVNLLTREGIDFVVPLTFNIELASLTPRDFIKVIQEQLRMKVLVVGTDFALGKDRIGGITTLEKLSQGMGFKFYTVPPLEINGEVVSSTAIRQAMAAGDMPRVRKLAGHYFSLHGKVVPGTGQGEGLGFPTANLNVNKGQALPPDGVYASWAHINGHTYESMTNVGLCPTFEHEKRTIETYILDYSGDLYGSDLSVDLVGKLRDEEKFFTIEDLKKQINEDIERGRDILKTVKFNIQ